MISLPLTKSCSRFLKSVDSHFKFEIIFVRILTSMNIRIWLNAFRLRTLPLALSCIAMGGFLAASAGAFQWDIFFLCIITTIFLQILSNLANDYGDSVHGADNAFRKGPTRAVQSGAISAANENCSNHFCVSLPC